MKHKFALLAASTAILASTTAFAADDIAAEAKALIAQHPGWANWLSDPELQKEALGGEQLPNSTWRVHDIRRPQPPVVDTGTGTCSVPTPSDAEMLFDGRDLSKWTGKHFDQWHVHDGVFTTGGNIYNFINTRESFGDIQVHLEWKTPAQPNPPADPQHHGNSGVFLMGLYEVQIVDSYRNETYPDGAAGGIYGTAPPLANPARPPETWNCYDIVFHAPRFAGDKLTAPGRVTVLFNGVLVQNDTELLGPTATSNGAVAHYVPGPAELPLALQDHGNPESHVSFRNVWVRRLPEHAP